MSDHPTLSQLDAAQPFVDRHVGPDDEQQARMLEALGFDSLDELMDAAVPGGIRAAADARPPRRCHGGAGGTRLCASSPPATTRSSR